ncbi:MAG TPA: TaqI-like C-terminal specificity domain-containing protein [Thermoanaerobaculia bacterium]|nr:TaqI-like C-terminal specificity domain-containing protein [Thermoanaerobaculia bacterium]
MALLDRIGTYSALGGEKIDLLEVRLTKEATLARARTALRNYVAHHLKKRGGKDAALVAFVSPTEKTWRFSFVRMEYGTKADEGGHVRTITELTPARRLSYLVGEGESCHTAKSRFVNLLQQTNRDPSIEEIEDAFSVEAVTQEFFERYRDLFLNIKEELDGILANNRAVAKEFAGKGLNSVDFSKKLLGQVVFLYFIQKKGWLGVAKGQPWGAGPQDFLRRLSRGEYGPTGNFFNDVLEPLFYDTLATDRGHAAWCDRFDCRIPFLNGGLFEPPGGYDWRSIDIALPDSVFMNDMRTSEGDIGTGILDVFDRYNFTVNESEPLEKDVAIDPEMLGKVFENLLEVRERKSKGSFYTPREIVHYMCQESLISYLDLILNKREEAIVTEPSVQTSLFGGDVPRQSSLKAPLPPTVPRDDLATFIRSGEQASHYEAARKEGTKSYLPKSIEKHARRIDDALQAVTICDPAIGSGAFPVGMMTEIVRARMTLTPYFNDLADRTPYYFKRHAIQTSLYGVDIDPGAVEIAKLRLWLSLVVDEEDVKQIKPLPNLDYKVVPGNTLQGIEKNLFNEAEFRELERLKPLFFDESDRDRKAAIKAQINGLLTHLTLKGETFDFEAFFSEVFHARRGFDIVIGNPPYVGFQGFMDQKAAIEKRYLSARGRYDYYVPFIEQGIRCLRESGVLAYICPTNFMKRDYGRVLRRLLLSENTLELIADFEDSQVFDGALNYTGVFVLHKGSPTPSHMFGYQKGSITASLQPVRQSSFSDEPWVFKDARSAEIIDLVLGANVTQLGDLAQGISEGIVTGHNNVFLLSDYEARRLGLESEFVRPCLRGREIRQFGHDHPAEVVIYPYTLDDGRTRAVPPEVLKKEGPHLWRYLNGRKSELAGSEYFAETTKFWFELWRQRDLSQLATRKILVPELADSCRFCLANGDLFYGDTVCGITLKRSVPENLLYILGILNSRLIDYFYRRTTVPKANGFYIYKTMFLKHIPIARINFEDTTQRRLHDQLVELVKEAIRATRGGKFGKDIDSRINQVVFKIYGIDEEVAANVPEIDLSSSIPTSMTRRLTKRQSKLRSPS